MTTNTRKLSPAQETREQLKAQLAEYLSIQPGSIQKTHQWMKRVEAAWLGIVLAVFALALYGSFAWGKTTPSMIPVAWFGFAASLSLMTCLAGLHGILIRAYPPVILPGNMPKFVSGSAAVWIGAASIVGGLVLAGIWIAFAFSTATFNLAMIAPLANILGIVIGVGVLGSILYTFYRKISS